MVVYRPARAHEGIHLCEVVSAVVGFAKRGVEVIGTIEFGAENEVVVSLESVRLGRKRGVREGT